MKNIIIMLIFGLFLIGNVYANTSCYNDNWGNTVCSDGTSAYQDGWGNTIIQQPNGQTTSCYTDGWGNTVCN